MRITVIGNQSQVISCQQRWADHDVVRYHEGDGFESTEVIVDYEFENNKAPFLEYKNTIIPVLISNVMGTISEIKSLFEPVCQVFGFNGENSFYDRPVLELSSTPGTENDLSQLMARLGGPCEIVQDKVGMVTPRVIAMIINEAYFTLEEGTASREDIDLGMRLGTNYPMGPFEWKDAWGIDRVKQLLEALLASTGDERYLVCPLLKQEAEASAA